MAAYSYYLQDYYIDAEAELIRFLKVYPNEKNVPYAHYLLGMVYYEKIVDENPYKTPMMIYPAVHYTMGGLWVDYNLMTTIPGC